MLIRTFSNLDAAQRAIATPDAKYIFLRHRLKNGDFVKQHVEKKNEWLLIRKGHFILGTAGAHYTYPDLEMNLKGRDVIVIFIPIGLKHSLKALSNLDYFVLKA